MDPVTSAHIPAINGFNPIVPEYGRANISVMPWPETGSFATIDAAIEAGRTLNDTFDTAAAVLQSQDGAFQLGLATHFGPDYVEELEFGADIAGSIVFEDPNLVALVSNAVARA